MLPRWIPLGRRGALLLFLLVPALALVSAAQIHHNWRSTGTAVGFGTVYAVKLVEWSLWALLVPIVVWLDRTHGFQRRSRAAATAVHVAGALVWFLAVNLILTVLTKYTDPAATNESVRSLYLSRLIFKLPPGLGVYAFVLAVYGFVHLAAERYEQTMREAQLQSQLADARLRHLQMQLQPHFLFNALHSIGGLVRDGDGERAVDMIAELSQLLRRAIGTLDRPEVPLDEELDFLDHYSRLQQMRFAERLRIRYDIEPHVRSALIPSLLLQPLVENAIRHGVERTMGPVEVTIGARSSNGHLTLEVSDTGPGLASAIVVEGIGLSTTRQRLEQMYGNEQSVTVESRRSGGMTARLVLPHVKPRGQQ